MGALLVMLSVWLQTGIDHLAVIQVVGGVGLSHASWDSCSLHIVITGVCCPLRNKYETHFLAEPRKLEFCALGEMCPVFQG